MSPDDVVPLGKTPYYARRAVAEAWAAAGYPPINSATRLKVEQKELFDGWQAGWDGYAPADDPDDPNAPLAHVRGVALDITPTPERVAALSRAGLVRPYSYEPWHWQLPGDVRRFPLITAFPSPAAPATPAPIPSEEDDMLALKIKLPNGEHMATLAPGIFSGLVESDRPDWVKDVVRSDDQWTIVPDERSLQTLLHKHGIDLGCYRLAGLHDLEIRDARTGVWSRGGRWSATDAVLGALGKA